MMSVMINGVEYTAVPEPKVHSCADCDFHDGNGGYNAGCARSQEYLPCDTEKIIWVKKEPSVPEKKELVATISQEETFTKQEIMVAFMSHTNCSVDAAAQFTDHVSQTKTNLQNYLQLKEKFKGIDV